MKDIMENKMCKPFVLKKEEGFVLVLALTIMLIMTVMGVSIMSKMSLDLQMTRNEKNSKLALLAAESALYEVMGRAGGTDLGTTRTLAGYTHNYFLGEPVASIPADDYRDPTFKWAPFQTGDAGYRSFVTTGFYDSSGTHQTYITDASGNAIIQGSTTRRAGTTEPDQVVVWLSYLVEEVGGAFCDSNTDGSNQSLDNAAVGYLNPANQNADGTPATKDCTTGEVVMYGKDFNFTSTGVPVGKYPVYQAVATATYGTTTRSVATQFASNYLNLDIGSGLNTNACVDPSGGGANNHVSDIVMGAGCADACGSAAMDAILDPALGAATCDEKTSNDDLESYLGIDIYEFAQEADESHDLSDIPPSGSLVQGLVSDWGSVGNERIIYIDNDGGVDVGIAGGLTGAGVLVITGNLTVQGNFSWNGLIYVLGEITFGGGGATMNVAGGIMTDNFIHLNGSIDVQYDGDYLQELGGRKGTPRLLSWKLCNSIDSIDARDSCLAGGTW